MNCARCFLKELPHVCTFQVPQGEVCILASAAALRFKDLTQL